MAGVKTMDSEPVKFNLSASVPTCTIDDYAISCSVTKRTVEGWIQRGYIPTIKMGKYRLINLAKLTEQLKKQ